MQLYPFAWWVSSCPSTFVEKSVLSPVDGLGTLSKAVWSYTRVIPGSLLHSTVLCLSLLQGHVALITGF